MLFLGLRTADNNPILTFPDSRAQLTFDEYHLLIAYLFQFPPWVSSFFKTIIHPEIQNFVLTWTYNGDQGKF